MNPDSHIDRGRQRFTPVWLWLLAAAVGVNLVQFPMIEGSAGPWYGAIPEYSSPAASQILGEHMVGVEETFGLTYRLAAVTESPQLTIPRSLLLTDHYRLRLASSEVTSVDYDPRVDGDTGSLLQKNLAVTGSDSVVGDYGVALRDESGAGDQLIVVVHDGMLIFADTSLLPPEFVESVNGS